MVQLDKIFGAAGGAPLLDMPILLEALEELTDGFVLFDDAHRLVICNRRYREIYAPVSDGWETGTPLTRIARDTARHCLGLEKEDEIEAWIAERVDSHREAGLSTSLQQFANGRWIQVNERLLKNGWSIGIRVDVTALKRSEIELASLLQRAESAAESKSAFLARMSHEIRTPLNAIIGFSSVIREETFGPLEHDRYRSYIEDIYNSADYLLGLIDSVLELSRDPMVENGSHSESSDCAIELGFCVRQIEDTAKSRGQKIEQRIKEPDARVSIGSASMRQIITNLLTNALKFSDDGETVRVSLQRTAKGWISISVIDRGAGIERADLARILLPFEQADSRPFGLSRGMGLGLSIVTGLCDRYGGRFAIRSRPGVGTVVRVSLPNSDQAPA